MKQLIQDLTSGKTLLEEVPVPKLNRGQVLIKTHVSLVSLGTEKMLVNFSKANYIQKARQQPDKVKQIIQKIKSAGLKPTMEAVFRKLGEPFPLGYCNAGEVIEVGVGVQGFNVGDRVVSNGPHAEVVSIPENLVAKIPIDVTYEEAAFTVIGAIALQGIRLINPTFGETVVVTGLGLIGLIATQLLKANGCKVIGIDIDDQKLKLASSWDIHTINGATQNVAKQVQDLTDGIGADAVLISASSKSDSIISQAAQMSRKKGRLVLTGVVGLDIQRSDFYEKELSFQVSCSYGPGRYDPKYEDKGLDYPISYVRWTEQRNFQVILQAFNSGQLDIKPLITKRVPLEGYQEVYRDMHQHGSIASLLEYNTQREHNEIVQIHQKSFSDKEGVLGLIGAGHFTRSMIVPVLKKLGANIKWIASAKGLSATTLAKKYNIGYSTSDARTIISDPDVDAVIITTRHNLHASHVIEAMEAGKHVFVEKPLAILKEDLIQIENIYRKSNVSLTVGFNRRFAPLIQEAKTLIGKAPINVISTMNAGDIPKDHWVQDMEIGGGRVIGEACHYIDLITFLTGSKVIEVLTNAQGTNPNINTDNVTILLKYKNGSTGVINYFSNGHKQYPKERIEVYDHGRNIVIDDFRKIKYFGYKSSNKKRSQDKGHQEQFTRWIQMILQGGNPIIPFNEVMNTSYAALASLDSLQKKSWIRIE